MSYCLCGRYENQYTSGDKFRTHLCLLTPVSILPHPFVTADIVVIHSYLQYLFHLFQSDEPYEVTNNFKNVSLLQTQTMLLRMDCLNM